MSVPSIDGLGALRAVVGHGARFWAPEDARIRADGWHAFSHAAAVDHNVVACFAARTAGAALEALLATNRPGVIMLAGEGLVDAQVLADADWICVGAMPLQVLTPLSDVSPAADSSVRRLDRAGLPSAHAVVGAAFGLDEEAALAAFPPSVEAQPNSEVWGLTGPDGRLVSCLGAERAGDAVVIWSMATAPDAQRDGYGARLLRAVLADAARAGATRSVLLASPAGLNLYRALGYTTIEHWQIWSRPRWAMRPR